MTLYGIAAGHTKDIHRTAISKGAYSCIWSGRLLTVCWICTREGHEEGKAVERFAAAAAALKGRDAADRAAYRAQRRERAAARKARARAHAAAEAEAGPAGSGGAVLRKPETLSESSSDGDDTLHEEDTPAQDAEGSELAIQTGKYLGQEYVGGRSKPFKEAAHHGMARIQTNQAAALDAMTLAEQEQMALQMLARGHC